GRAGGARDLDAAGTPGPAGAGALSRRDRDRRRAALHLARRRRVFRARARAGRRVEDHRAWRRPVVPTTAARAMKPVSPTPANGGDPASRLIQEVEALRRAQPD